jgi:hypothetical protein
MIRYALVSLSLIFGACDGGISSKPKLPPRDTSVAPDTSSDTSLDTSTDDASEPDTSTVDTADTSPDTVDPTPVDLALRPAPGKVVAGLATKPADLIGGPKAEGQLGDIVLENNLATFLIEGIRPCGGYRQFGGTLIDADLQPGGEDRFGELWLIWNLLAFEPTRATIVSDGDDGLAVARIEGRTVPYIWITALTGDLLFADPVPLAVTYEYRLAPDSKTLELRVLLENDEAIPADVSLPVLAANFGDGAPAFATGSGLDAAAGNVPWVGAVGLDRAYGFIPAPDATPSALFQATNVQISLLPAFLIPPGGSHELTFHYAVTNDGTTSLEATRSTLHNLPSTTLTGTVDGHLGFTDEEPPSLTGGHAWVAITREADVLALTPVRPDGSFTATIPGGLPVTVQAFAPGRGASPILIADTNTPLTLALPALGEVIFRVRDPSGDFIPAQVSIFRDDAPSPFAPAPVRFGHDWGRSRSAVLYQTESEARVHLLPGTYTAVASRGYSWELDQVSLTVAPGTTQTIDLKIEKSVDDSGFASADLHLHSFWSPDADVPYPARLRQAAVNDVALPVFTEHTYLGDVASARPIAAVDPWVTPIPGQEVTTFEYGHFNAYPLVYDKTRPSGGAVFEHGWPGTGLFDQVRAQHDGDLILQINHPRISSPIQAYFNAIGLDSEALSQLEPDRWTLDWEVLEVFNAVCAGDAGNLRTLQDWFNLNDHGLKKTLGSGSDSHSEPAGIGHPRSWVEVSRDAVDADYEAFVAPLRSRRSFVSCGPFLRFTGPNGEPMGSLVRPVEGQATFKVKVEAPSWIAVDTIRLLENGVPVATVDLSAWSRPEGLRSAIRYEGTLSAPSRADAWYVLEVLGSGNLWPIESSDAPYAMSNPIDVDSDGDGLWTPPAQTRTTRAPAFRAIPKDLPEHAHRHDVPAEDPARHHRHPHRHPHSHHPHSHQ